MVFTNVKIGIACGKAAGNAETALLRCKFIRCSEDGFYMTDFNSLDWWCWYCTFEDCGVGLCENQGCLHAYHCLFKRSKVADIYLVNSGAFGFRYNYSIGSQAFLIAKHFPYGNYITLQENVILDTRGEFAVDDGHYGALLLLDNTLRSAREHTGPEVHSYADLIAVGNTFTTAQPYSPLGRLYTQDEHGGKPLERVPGEPVMPGAVPHMQRAVFEVPVNGDGAAIQQAINAAAASGKARPVVHFPSGRYVVAQTIVVPSAPDVQLVGDGMMSTRLDWHGAADQPVIRCAGPSHATLRELTVNADKEHRGDCLLIEGANQPGSRVYLDQFFPGDVGHAGLWVNKADRTLVEGHDFEVGALQPLDVLVTGGAPAVQENNPTLSGCRLFCNNAGLYGVEGGGSLLVKDLYSEISAVKALSLTDAGTFTLDTGIFKRTIRATTSSLDVRNFRGSATLLCGCICDMPVRVEGDGAHTNLLVANSALSYFGEKKSEDPPFFTNAAENAKALLFSSTTCDEKLISHPLPDQGKMTPDFMHTMLTQARTEHSQRLAIASSRMGLPMCACIEWPCGMA